MYNCSGKAVGNAHGHVAEGRALTLLGTRAAVDPAFNHSLALGHWARCKTSLSLSFLPQ